MRDLRFRWFVAITFAMFLITACHSLIPVSRPSISQITGACPVKKFTLKNKLPVLICEEPESKVVTLDVWVNTGSADEPVRINGASHFLEHMLFKGTERRGVGEIDREIESVGGIWNAATSIEFTHFYLTVGTPFVNVGIDTLSDVITSATLNPIEVEKERQVILEEYYRQQDNPSEFLMCKAYGLSFEKSQNKRPVLGTPKTINAITRERLCDYYVRRYAPENMVLVVAGGVKAKTILPELEEKFGALGRVFKPNSHPVIKTVRRTGIRREFRKPVKESYIIIAFPAPDFSNPDEVSAADVLSYILGAGRSSRLYSRVKDKKRLVSSVGASFPTHRRDSLFLIYATFDCAKKGAVIDALLEEAKNLAEKRVSHAELEKAKRMITNQCAFSHETTAGKAAEIGFYYTLTGDTKFEETYLEKIAAVKAADIKRLAAKYLNPTKANIFIVKPE